MAPGALIDTHAHLDGAPFAADLPAVLERAQAAGVRAIVTLGVDLASSQQAVALAHTHTQIFAAAGVSPHDAGAFAEGDWPALQQLWQDARVVAIGETGLDYHYDHSPRERQRQLFARHLEASAETRLPISIHVREAYDDTFAAIESHGLSAGGVLHCFAGGMDECRRAVALGLHISLAGIVTFRQAEALRAVAETVPDDRLLVETDAPYLAPVPHRGRRNEPAFVADTTRQLAALRGVAYEDLCAQTAANALRLFGRLAVAAPADVSFPGASGTGA